jgi:Fur family transcriptional regulator, ferric uptake regulator
MPSPQTKHSAKRDRIVEVFLRQEGHISADDLVAVVRRAAPGIGRATVYRTLQWMVGAGLARKVDFGEGRARFEPAERHPRHFHLICSKCHRSSEFLSSDVEALMEEIANAHRFAASQSVVQIHGVCEECRTGRAASPIDGSITARVFARDALRMAIATEKSGREFYARAAKLTTDARGRKVFQKLASEEDDHLGKLQRRYQELARQDPEIELRPTFLFFKGAASGLFGAGVHELHDGIDDREALRIAIRCERGSHEFFKKYASRFEESEGKRIFSEFADEEREHLDLLIREYKTLTARQIPRKSAR